MPNAEPPSPRLSGTLSSMAGDDPAVRWPVRTPGSRAEQADTLLNRAQAQIHLQRWADALISLEAVILLLPGHDKALDMRQRVLERLGLKD